MICKLQHQKLLKVNVIREITRHYEPPGGSSHTIYEMGCGKKLTLNLVKTLDLTTNIQDMQETEKHIKWHLRDAISKIQTVGNSTTNDSFSSTQDCKERSFKEKKERLRRKSIDMQETYQS